MILTLINTNNKTVELSKMVKNIKNKIKIIFVINNKFDDIFRVSYTIYFFE